MGNFHKNVWVDQRGTTALEFAIVGPIFILLVIGTIYFCTCLFVIGSIHYAVEEGARCASVRSTTQCTDATTVKAYTQSRYFGPTSPPTLVYDPAAACGRSVSGSINYVVDVGLRQITVPISATACFPYYVSPAP
ncbi:MAG TPA: TadE family protein [Pseudolabrys sp.]